MCNLYSMTKNQDAIRRLFSFDIDNTGNLPAMPGIFPDYPAPIVRNKADATELTLARWGMPSSQFAQMQAAKKRAAKLQDKGMQIDFKELLRLEPDSGTTNIAISIASTGSAGSVSSPDALCHSHPSVNSIKLRVVTSGLRSMRPGLWHSSRESGRTGRRFGRSKRARRPTTSSPFSPPNRMPKSAQSTRKQCPLS
jgi:hypothetical protein